jgi:hypothetical protein
MLHQFPRFGESIGSWRQRKSPQTTGIQPSNQCLVHCRSISRLMLVFCLQGRKLTAQSRQLDIDGEGAEPDAAAGERVRAVVPNPVCSIIFRPFRAQLGFAPCGLSFPAWIFPMYFVLVLLLQLPRFPKYLPSYIFTGTALFALSSPHPPQDHIQHTTETPRSDATIPTPQYPPTKQTS